MPHSSLLSAQIYFNFSFYIYLFFVTTIPIPNFDEVCPRDRTVGGMLPDFDPTFLESVKRSVPLGSWSGRHSLGSHRAESLLSSRSSVITE